MDEEGVLSILRGREGWNEQYSSISEFKHHLNQASPLADEKSRYGWVLRNEYDSNNIKIITLLKHIVSDFWLSCGRYLVQYWAVVKVEGPHHYLSTSHQPFCVGQLSKGVSWYRNLSSQYEYHVDMEGAEAEKEQLGGVGRAYRNRRPESTTDLRLYSTNEFPLRDNAARCGFRGYLALPLFDLHQNQCYGVLELLSYDTTMNVIFCALDEGLKMAELRSAHVDFIPFDPHFIMPHKYQKPPAPAESEIREILEVAIMQVPRLSLAQVWVPCKQCANMSTNLRCMERASFIEHRKKKINICIRVDEHMYAYLQASEFHNLQIDLNCLRPNLCDLSMSKNPLAHYAARARLSLCFTICLQSVSNDLYVIQFCLQPKCREDACADSSLHLLLRIIDMKLRSFIFVSREQLPEELLVQSGQPNAIECESIDKLNVMNSFEEELSESNFTAYLETGDSCCLRPSSGVGGKGRRAFCGPTEEKLVEINDVKSYSLLLPVSMKEKIEDFMKKTVVEILWNDYWIVQFWVPKMAEDRCYLETSDQPYAVGCLAKGLASFRKECIKHHYFVDEETKEEELGPLGRVFRNGQPEITPDLNLYSTKEFSMRNYAVHCGLQGYCAFPVFEKLKSKCAGVLEFVGLTYYSKLEDIGRALKEAKLHSIHSNFQPNFLAEQKPANIINCRKEALGEVRDAFDLIKKIPHLHMAKVWVPYDRCASVNGYSKWMELALTTEDIREYMPTDEVHWTHVQPKKGIICMVLESESKSCFCQNLSKFSIIDQPLGHFQRRERVDVCFAICLQSSHTGDLLYILEFFLNPSLDYLHSFFSFLLPIMKHELISFKMASGKQLGEEFVVDVIKFSEANRLNPSELHLPDMFSIKFKSVQYGQKEHPFTTEQSVPCATETEQCNVNASNLKRTERGKRKTGLHISLDVLKPHYGKKLKEVAEELGVGRSTIKRACREHGIGRWPGNKKQARNPSFFERESVQDPHQQKMQPSSSSSLHQNEPHTTIESTQNLIVGEEAEKVIIRVKYEEDTIKFELCLSLGVSKVFDEVARRLNLKMGSFKLKYVDEDNEEILISCDDDLQLCPRTQTATGKTCIQLFVPK